MAEPLFEAPPTSMMFSASVHSPQPKPSVMKFLHSLLGLALFVMLSSCASFERLAARYDEMLGTSDLGSATKLIENKKWYQRDRNKVLYYLELGALARMQGNLNQSNDYLNQADRLIEDYRASAAARGLAMASNARVLPYRTEYFENIAVHYFKSLNYLQLDNLNAARVEARRTNIKLQQLNDAVPDKPLKYHDDVLGHIMMGLSYEKNGDWNNAFIAYRNAANLFIEDNRLTTYMGSPIPEQLKCDVVRMAERTGFGGEVTRYTRLLTPRCAPESEAGELVLFWENGKGPVKEEQILGFDVSQRGANSQVRFVNQRRGYIYDLNPNDFNQFNGNDFIGLGVNNIRVALPSYIPRFYPLRSARVFHNGKSTDLELITDLGQVAQQSLEDRFHRELANALIRLAIKEATEASLRAVKTPKKDSDDDNEEKGKEEKSQEYDETAGILLSGAMGIVNTLTERADLRSWQSLPGQISYARIPLKRGSNSIKISFYNQGRARAEEHHFQVMGRGGLVVRSIATPNAVVIQPSRTK